MRKVLRDRFCLSLLLLMIFTIMIVAQEQKIPSVNWSILQGTPLRSTSQGNMRVDIFKVENPRKDTIDYALAICTSIEDTPIVIIWIRGTTEDTRIIFTGTKGKGLSTVYISKTDFEKYFKYCVLSGISSTNPDKATAMFGGGPAGDRDEYWFEWSESVNPTFYCILK